MASGERCVCGFVKESIVSRSVFFVPEAFEQVCGDISLKQHCKDRL